MIEIALSYGQIIVLMIIWFLSKFIEGMVEGFKNYKKRPLPLNEENDKI